MGLTACEESGRWERALSLLGEMRAAGLAPDAKGYNEMISVCGRAKQWRMPSAGARTQMLG